MKALRSHKIIKKDGEIHLVGLPCKKGQHVDLIVLIETPDVDTRPSLTARQFLDSGLVGLWKDRTDIDDSATFARYLREQAQRRDRG